MPDFLYELEATTGSSGSRGGEQPENIEKLLQAISEAIQRIRWGVEHSKGSVALFEKTWQGLVAAVAEGRTAEVQQVRERFLEAVDKRIHLLRHTRALARLMRDRGMPEIRDPAILAPELAGMEQFKSRLFDRWQTPEDLEDLAKRFPKADPGPDAPLPWTPATPPDLAPLPLPTPVLTEEDLVPGVELPWTPAARPQIVCHVRGRIQGIRPEHNDSGLSDVEIADLMAEDEK